MPTSVPGNKRVFWPARRPGRGFTLLELLLVLALVAIMAGLASLALRDNSATQLEREAVRLAALLEMARAESRVSGTAVRWVPGAGPTATGQRTPEGAAPAGFRFVGLSGQNPLPSHWLDERVNAEVAAPGWLSLGPEAILPQQRVLLRLEDQQIEVSSDGLGPFNVGSLPATPPP